MKGHHLKRLLAGLFAFCVVLSLAAGAVPKAAAVESISIVSGMKDMMDDSEEWVTSGTPDNIGMIDYNSSDLEICDESPTATPTGNQIIATRFSALAIPQGATITSAYIQFTADKDKDAGSDLTKNKGTTTFDVNIFAENVSNSAPIENVKNNLSSRALTTDAVRWYMNDDATKWTTMLEAGVLQKTPDISSLVQQIINRTDWASGNALCFEFKGTGNRTAATSEDAADMSTGPVLHLTYTYTANAEQAAPTGLAGVAPTTGANNDGQITGTTTDMEYKLSSSSAWTACTGTTVTGLTAGSYDVRYAAKTGLYASPAVTVLIPLPAVDLDQAAPTGLAAVAPTTSANNDGQMIGTTTAMEYKLSTDTSWTSCTGTAVTGLASGSYEVRYAAKTGYNASASTMVTVPTYVAYTVKDITMQPGTNETARNFCWYSNSSLSTAQVQIAAKSAMTGTDFPVSAATTFSGTAVTSGSWRSCAVSATGLAATTEYVYRLSDGTGFSGVYSFKTGDTGSYSAILVGDPQIGCSGNITSDADSWKNTVTDALTTAPDASFILSAGDQVETSTSEAQYDGFFSPTELTSVALAPTVGNHDNGALYGMHFNGANESATYGTTSAGGDYWFVYGNTLYMDLNSNNQSSTSHDAFMASAIAAAGTGIKWKVVMFHHSIYSSASHSTDSDIATRRTSLVPVFDKYGIDVVLSGHDHCYTRSYIMKNGAAVSAITDTSATNAAGTLYITANSASGSKYYDIKDADSAYRAYRWQDYTPSYSTVTVTGTSFTITTYRTDTDAVIDTFTLNKDQDQAAPTGLAAVAPTTSANNDGQLIGTTTAMEYKLSTDTSWTACTGTVVTGLASGSYDVRVAAKTGYNASATTTVTVPTYVAYTVKDITMQPGTNETARNFCWYANSNLTTAQVQIAPKSAMTGTAFPTASATTFSGTAVTSGSWKSSEVSVTGLSTTTEYVYRLSDGTGFSDVYSFKTGDTGSYSAILVGDPQIGCSGNITSDADGWKNTVTDALTTAPDASFILSAGDQVETSTSEAQYDGFFSPTELTSVALAPTVGNHDNGTLYGMHFNGANESTTYGITSAGGDYWFVYGNTLYMDLNSNNQSATSHDAFIASAIAAAGTGIKWKVVMFHHSIYSSASHSTDTDIAARRTGLVPVFDKYGIDVVLSGHDHCYTRSYIMKNGAAVSAAGDTSAMNAAGTLYITANSASGSKYYDIKDADSAYRAFRWQDYTPSYSTVTVTGTSFTITTYRTDTDAVIDTFTLNKADAKVLAAKDALVTKMATGKYTTASVAAAQLVVDAVNTAVKEGSSETNETALLSAISGASEGLVLINQVTLKVAPNTIVGDSRSTVFSVSVAQLQGVDVMEGLVTLSDSRFEISDISTPYTGSNFVFTKNLDYIKDGTTAYFSLAQVGGFTDTAKMDVVTVTIKLKDGQTAASLEAVLSSVKMYISSAASHAVTEVYSGITGDGTATTALWYPSEVAGDLTGDKAVTGGDLSLAMTSFGANNTDADWYSNGAWKVDINNDGVIDIGDLTLIACLAAKLIVL